MCTVSVRQQRINTALVNLFDSPDDAAVVGMLGSDGNIGDIRESLLENAILQIRHWSQVEWWSDRLKLETRKIHRALFGRSTDGLTVSIIANMRNR